MEDEPVTLALLEDCLEQLGYSLAGTTATGEGAIKLAAELRPDVVLMDISLGGNSMGSRPFCAGEGILYNSLHPR